MSSGGITSERAPQQDRSRQSWERVLAAGMELFEDGGWHGLTITEVCRRARVSAPSIYARVDGKAGLFRAVHERWLVQIRETEDALIRQHVRDDASVEDASAAVATVVTGVFELHGRALRALIVRSVQDDELLSRGSRASRALIERLGATLPLPIDAGQTAVRAVYSECVLRAMFGSKLLGPVDESPGEFDERMVRLALALSTDPAHVTKP